MAVSTCIFTENSFPSGRALARDKQIFFGIITIGGASGTYPANGLPLNFTPGPPVSNTPPIYGDLNGVAGYVYVFDPVHQTVRIYQSGVESASAAPLAELATNSTTPSGVTGDTIQAMIITPLAF